MNVVVQSPPDQLVMDKTNKTHQFYRRNKINRQFLVFIAP